MAKSRGFLGYTSLIGQDDPWMRVPGHAQAYDTKQKPKDTRNWQQKTRDWLNEQGRYYLGQHGDQAFGLLGTASEFTDAADLRDAMDYGGRTTGALARGDYWSAAGNAPWMLMATGAAMMPGVSMGAADEVAEGAAKGIRAYHGSPHDFDRFDMSKIGTGEGAQAYGHGLYFAENEGVAKGYRDGLINTVSDTQSPQGAVERALGMASGDRAKAREILEGNLRSVQNTVTKMGSNTPPAFAARVGEYTEAIRMLDGGYSPGGRMYEVRINADPESFLDWDKPLSEQPEAVRKAIDATRKKLPPNAHDDLGGDYSLLYNPENRPGQFLNTLEAIGGRPDTGEQLLKEAGIPGIKYLDAGSRAAGDGSRNYVVFDDKLIEIVRKYGIAGASAMLGYNLLDGMDPAQAEELKRVESTGGGGW